MKAFLLAAGRGTRLRPITDKIPKCLVPIGGKPLLGHWLESLTNSGVTEVLVNVHHLAHLVESYVAKTDTECQVRLVREPYLLGSAGTLKANRWFVSTDEHFLVCYADNFTDVDLCALWDEHSKHTPLVTLGLFQSTEPSSCGIVDLDSDGWITNFEEKPKNPRSNLANGGLYVFTRDVLDYLPDVVTRSLDIGFDLLPNLVGKMRGVLLDGCLMDIGTPERYRRAQRIWARRLVTQRKDYLG